MATKQQIKSVVKKVKKIDKSYIQKQIPQNVGVMKLTYDELLVKIKLATRYTTDVEENSFYTDAPVGLWKNNLPVRFEDVVKVVGDGFRVNRY